MQTPLFSTVAAERQVKISLWKTTSNPLTATELLRPCSLCMVTWVLWLTTCLTHMHLYVRLFSVSNLSLMCDIFSIFYLTVTPSSDTQGQIVGARESRDGQKKKVGEENKGKGKSFYLCPWLFFAHFFVRPSRLSLAPLSAPVCPRMQ